MKIVKASIDPRPVSIFDPEPKVRIQLEDGTEKDLFEFDPDRNTFSEGDFVGKTEEEAEKLKPK